MSAEQRQVEEIASRVLLHGWCDGDPCNDCRAVASALRAEREVQREDEDAACRLEELRCKLFLPEGSPEEIAGSISTILDGQKEALETAWARAEAAEARAARLEDALREMPCSCADTLHDEGSPACAKNIARAALGAPQESANGR